MDDTEKKLKIQMQALRLKHLQSKLEATEDAREIEELEEAAREEAREAIKKDIIELLSNNAIFPMYNKADLLKVINEIRRL